MEQNLENYDCSLKDADVKKKNIDKVRKLQKCSQCDYASSHASHLRQHLKTHSGEKENKCNRCDYASSRADVLRIHLKTHSGEKSFFRILPGGHQTYSVDLKTIGRQDY